MGRDTLKDIWTICHCKNNEYWLCKNGEMQLGPFKLETAKKILDKYRKT